MIAGQVSNRFGNYLGVPGVHSLCGPLPFVSGWSPRSPGVLALPMEGSTLVASLLATLSVMSHPGFDGSVYVVETECSYSKTESLGFLTVTTTACLNGIDPKTGSLASQVTLPNSSATSITGQHCDIAAFTETYNSPGLFSSPMVAPDGSVYMEMVVSRTTSDTECSNEGDTETNSGSESISILKNGTQFQTVASTSGNDGLLASYFDEADSGAVTIANTGSGAKSVLSNIGTGFAPGISMVLGDNNTAFVKDGTHVAAIDATTLQQNWAYTSTGRHALVY
jgi:hypothetical protein